jgi:hypothetical protein
VIVGNTGTHHHIMQRRGEIFFKMKHVWHNAGREGRLCPSYTCSREHCTDVHMCDMVGGSFYTIRVAPQVQQHKKIEDGEDVMGRKSSIGMVAYHVIPS